MPITAYRLSQPCRVCVFYRVGQRCGTIFFLYTLTLPNINRFSKLFHHQNQEKMCNNTVTKDPTTPQVCRYTTLWNVSVLKATIENKTTYATTHFKKLKTGNNVFIVWIIVKSNCLHCHILQVLHQIFNVSALLLDDALKPATPLTDQWRDQWLKITGWAKKVNPKCSTHNFVKYWPILKILSLLQSPENLQCSGH